MPERIRNSRPYTSANPQLVYPEDPEASRFISRAGPYSIFETARNSALRNGFTSILFDDAEPPRYRVGFVGIRNRCGCISVDVDPPSGFECTHCERCDQCSNCCGCYTCANCGNHNPMLTGLPRCAACMLCSTCCTCTVCESCNYPMRSGVEPCANCEGCRNCCRCRRCQSCNLTVRRDDWCPNCGRCFGDCCECEDLHHGNAGAPFLAENRSERKAFDCKRTLGVEWEFNDLDRARFIAKWQRKWRGGVHSDGSCGEEIVTAPLAGDNVVNCLEDLGKAFREARARADHRCGIHVHVDAKDLGWHDIFKLIRVYSKIEALLYLLAGQNRLDNQYCEPCGPQLMRCLAADDPKGAILSDCYAAYSGRQYKKDQAGRVDKKSGRRYRGLNLQPWLAGRTSKKVKSDTTIEFRLHRNTLDAYRVIGWAKVCARLVDWTVKASDQDIENLPANSARALAEVIAPDCAPWIVGRIMAWHKATKRRNRKVIFKSGNYQAVSPL